MASSRQLPNRLSVGVCVEFARVLAFALSLCARVQSLSSVFVCRREFVSASWVRQQVCSLLPPQAIIVILPRVSAALCAHQHFACTAHRLLMLHESVSAQFMTTSISTFCASCRHLLELAVFCHKQCMTGVDTAGPVAFINAHWAFKFQVSTCCTPRAIHESSSNTEERLRLTATTN